jgi:hypothetical protein
MMDSGFRLFMCFQDTWARGPGILKSVKEIAMAWKRYDLGGEMTEAR